MVRYSRKDVRKWETISYYTLASRSVKGEYPKFAKRLRVSKRIINSKQKIFIDIRDFNGERSLRKGICFSLEEFKWFMSEIRVKNRKVWFKKGEREIFIDCYNWSGKDYIISLITDSKSTIYTLDRKELYFLAKYYKFIKKDIRDMQILFNEPRTLLGKSPEGHDDTHSVSESDYMEINAEKISKQDSYRYSVDEVDNEIYDNIVDIDLI